MTSSNNQRDAA